MELPLNSIDLTGDQLKELIRYTQPRNDYRRAKALNFLLSAASGSNLTTAQLINLNPEYAAEIKFAEETRACGLGDRADINSPPFIAPDIKSTFGTTLLHRTCYEKCWFGITGKGRSVCEKARNISLNLAMEALDMGYYPVKINSFPEEYWRYRYNDQSAAAKNIYGVVDKDIFTPEYLNNPSAINQLREKVGELVFNGIIPFPYEEETSIESLNLSFLAAGQLYTHVNFDITRNNGTKNELVATFPIGPLDSVTDRILRQDAFMLGELSQKLVKYPQLQETYGVNTPQYMSVIDGLKNQYPFYLSSKLDIHTIILGTESGKDMLYAAGLNNDSQTYRLSEAWQKSILECCCITWLINDGMFSNNFSLDAGDIALQINSKGSKLYWMTYRNGAKKMSQPQFIHALQNNLCRNASTKQDTPIFANFDIKTIINELQEELGIPLPK